VLLRTQQLDQLKQVGQLQQLSPHSKQLHMHEWCTSTHSFGLCHALSAHTAMT
jgi:hypothetical protein